MFVRGFDDQRRTPQSFVRLDVTEEYPRVGRDDGDLQAGHLWIRRGYDGAVLSNEGGSEDLLCEITLGRRQTYDDDLPEEVTLDVLLDLAFVRVDLESLVQHFGQLGVSVGQRGTFDGS